MVVGVLKESIPETRVSLLPEHLPALKKLNIDVLVETDAGVNAFATNEKYQQAGAKMAGRNEILTTANIILSINNFTSKDVLKINAGTIILGVYQPLYNAAIIKDWANKGLTIFSIDMLPRTSRAQGMDVLSSQANIAGYKAVLLAANLFPRYFPMLMTAAGSIPPARVLVLGAGVAGLQAIATARRLGAVVEVFDTRPAVKEEGMSLGGKFI